MPGEPLPDDASGLRAANAGLRAVVGAKDAENALLRTELDAERELRKRLELRLAELERRLGMDSTDSGTPSSKERVGAKVEGPAPEDGKEDSDPEEKEGTAVAGAPHMLITDGYTGYQHLLSGPHRGHRAVTAG